MVGADIIQLMGRPTQGRPTQRDRVGKCEQISGLSVDFESLIL
jgi:hypothetical protein